MSDTSSAASESVLPYFFAGIMGFAGVIMLSMGAHSPATGLMATGGQFLLFHAPAVLVVALQTRFGGVYKRAALALLLVGPTLFSAEMAFHTASQSTALTVLAPIGGVMTGLGWLCLAIGAIRSQKV